MNTLFSIILSTFLVSLISFAGVVVLFFKKDFLEKILVITVTFSAGALMGGAFLHLLPEAIEKAAAANISSLYIFLSTIIGFCVIFIFEQFLNWHHHHAIDHPEIKTFSYLILYSDAAHNFIDGLSIAASFVAGAPIGFVTSLAIAFHEIPKEIGDFGVLVYGGIERSKALLFNFLSATVAILGGIIGFLLFEEIKGLFIYILSFAAGNFLYIVGSDLIPEIKDHISTNKKKGIVYFFTFLAGIGLMLLLRFL